MANAQRVFELANEFLQAVAPACDVLDTIVIPMMEKARDAADADVENHLLGYAQGFARFSARYIALYMAPIIDVHEDAATGQAEETKLFLELLTAEIELAVAELRTENLETH